MKEANNLFERLQDMVGDKNATINILQEQIDLSLQVEYFKKSKKIKKGLDKEYDYLSEVSKLYAPEVEIEEKKTIICQLAAFEKVSYFRALEKFRELADEPMQAWVTLAIQESRMLLESTLLDQKQLFISTGLGGKGSQLRYFVVLISTSKSDYSSTQQNLINNEFAYSLKKNGGELEEIVFEDKFAMLTCLLPIQKPIQDILNKTTKECNTFGEFIQENFLITNVKKMSSQEIDEFLDSQQESGGMSIEIDPGDDDLENNTEDE